MPGHHLRRPWRGTLSRLRNRCRRRCGFMLADACVALALAGLLAVTAAGVNAHITAARATLEPVLQARAGGAAAGAGGA